MVRDNPTYGLRTQSFGSDIKVFDANTGELRKVTDQWGNVIQQFIPDPPQVQDKPCRKTRFTRYITKRETR